MLWGAIQDTLLCLEQSQAPCERDKLGPLHLDSVDWSQSPTQTTMTQEFTLSLHFLFDILTWMKPGHQDFRSKCQISYWLKQKNLQI